MLITRDTHVFSKTLLFCVDAISSKLVSTIVVIAVITHALSVVLSLFVWAVCNCFWFFNRLFLFVININNNLERFGWGVVCLTLIVSILFQVLIAFFVIECKIFFIVDNIFTLKCDSNRFFKIWANSWVDLIWILIFLNHVQNFFFHWLLKSDWVKCVSSEIKFGIHFSILRLIRIFRWQFWVQIQLEFVYASIVCQTFYFRQYSRI